MLFSANQVNFNFVNFIDYKYNSDKYRLLLNEAIKRLKVIEKQSTSILEAKGYKC